MKRMTLWLAVFAMVGAGFGAVPAFAQQADATPLPWFMITFRPELGGGGGTMDLNWKSTVLNQVDAEEEARLEGLGYGGLTTEAFFMPTSGRHFIISPLLSFGGGSGQFDEAGGLVTGQDVRYTQWVLALGLGYQWYFGALEKTNLYLMGHLGGGRIVFAVDNDGEWENSDGLGLGYFDVTVGSTHRWDNGFLLGGALVLAGERYQGTTEAGDFWDVETSGSLRFARLGLVIGYAMK